MFIAVSAGLSAKFISLPVLILKSMLDGACALLNQRLS